MPRQEDVGERAATPGLPLMESPWIWARAVTLVRHADSLMCVPVMQTWCRGKRRGESELLRLDCHKFLWHFYEASVFKDRGTASMGKYLCGTDMVACAADVVPGQEDVGERAAVPGLPPLLLALLQGPGLQDARGVRARPLGRHHRRPGHCYCPDLAVVLPVYFLL